jgi:hypothetical protein
MAGKCFSPLKTWAILMYTIKESILVAVRFKELVCGYLFTWIAGSNPQQGVNIRRFCFLCVVLVPAYANG